MSGDDQNQTQEPTQSDTTPMESITGATVQQRPVQEVQHVRIGGSQGAGVRVQHMQMPPTRHMVDKSRVHEDVRIHHSVLLQLREYIDGDNPKAALAMIDAWLGVADTDEAAK